LIAWEPVLESDCGFGLQRWQAKYYLYKNNIPSPNLTLFCSNRITKFNFYLRAKGDSPNLLHLYILNIPFSKMYGSNS